MVPIIREDYSFTQGLTQLVFKGKEESQVGGQKSLVTAAVALFASGI